MGEMNDWKSYIYTRVQKSETMLEAPENFDEWLNERIMFRKDSGKYLISDENRDVFFKVFRDGKTLQSIGNEYSVTRENIRQRKERVIKSLIVADKYLTPKEWAFKNGSVFELPLPTRVENCIYANNITTLKQLDEMLSDGRLRNMRGIGRKAITELRAMLTEWKIMQEEEKNAKKEESA